MNVRTLAVFVLVLVSPLSARAASWPVDSSFGVDVKSCQDWLRDRRGNPELANRDVSWMFGFLTALVRSEGPSGKGGVTAEDFTQEIDVLCIAHPNMDIGQILEIFAKQHDLIKSQSDPR